jgi:hypothetical protein
MDNKYYKAKEGYTYKRIVDGFIMGNDLYLGDFIDGSEDVITNYEEVIDDTPKEERPDKKRNMLQKKEILK